MNVTERWTVVGGVYKPMGLFPLNAHLHPHPHSFFTLTLSNTHHFTQFMLLAQANDLPCNCQCASVVGKRGGVKERGMSAGRDGTINQDCRGMKIGGWGSGRMEERGQKDKDTIRILQILSSKSLTSFFEAL